MNTSTISIILNSHIDPVWIWDYSSGRRSWTNTAESAVRILREMPDLTYVCSAAAMYRWIEDTNPRLFEDIRALVKEGRWEITGGWEVQSDTIIAQADSLRRQGVSGKAYFQEKFGIDVRTAYCVDSFGHNLDIPDILGETGFDNYVYVRGQDMPELFRWKGPAGHTLLAHQIRDGYCQPASWTIEDFRKKVEMFMQHPGNARTMFVGVGDHGGAVSRKHISYLHELMKEYPLKFSTLTQYFADHKNDDLMEFQGDLGPAFRGCYSANHRVKQQVAEAETLLIQAEKIGGKKAENELKDAWLDDLMCNFHDSLPGTCTKVVYERDVYPMLGGAIAKARTVIDKAIAVREAKKNTLFAKEGGLYAVNLGKQDAFLPVSYPGFLDPDSVGTNLNAVQTEDGELLPIQVLPSPSSFGPCGMPWGNITAVLPVKAGTDRAYALIRTDKKFADVDPAPIREFLDQIEWEICPDDHGTWGFGLDSYTEEYGVAEKVSETFIPGPVCAIAKVVYRWSKSTIKLEVRRYFNMPVLNLNVECDWHDNHCAVKLAWINPGNKPESTLLRKRQLTVSEDFLEDTRRFHWNGFDTQTPEMTNSGEMPFVGWCALRNNGRTAGFWSPDLHGCDAIGNKLRVTFLRCMPYADHKPFSPRTELGLIDEGWTAYNLWFWENDPSVIEAINSVLYCEMTPHEGEK